jgi:hypothetical protein
MHFLPLRPHFMYHNSLYYFITIVYKVTMLKLYLPIAVWKTRRCQFSFRLLMMGGMSPETCWASYKYGIIKCWYIFASCCIFFMNCTIMHRSTNIKALETCLCKWDRFRCLRARNWECQLNVTFIRCSRLALCYKAKNYDSSIFTLCPIDRLY